jgi:tetratricopeptide (TPR) repeat protein
MTYLTLKMALLSLVLVYYQPGFAAMPAGVEMSEVKEIQQQWAQLYYMDEFKDQNYKQLQALAQHANQLSQAHPESAEALVWDAIVLSTLAEKKGGIGALSLVKEAKTKLEHAKELNPDVLGGAIYASLGTLYSKVPGWPIGFGNDHKAEQHFKRALEIDPQGLEANYFFAEYLADNDQQELAMEYVEKALHAPSIVGRPVADEGRRKQAQKLRERLLEF